MADPAGPTASLTGSICARSLAGIRTDGRSVAASLDRRDLGRHASCRPYPRAQGRCASPHQMLIGAVGNARLRYTVRMQQYDIGLVIRALEFAAKKHRMQRRKDSDASPYINHPIALMRVLCIGGILDPAILAAAALHDTIEDTETTRAELEAEFGAKVADLVVEMTDDKSLPKMARKRLQIEHAQRMSEEGALVKLADKICNLRDMAVSPPEGWNLERRIEYFDWAKAVVDGLPRVCPGLIKLFDEAYAGRPVGLS